MFHVHKDIICTNKIVTTNFVIIVQVLVTIVKAQLIIKVMLVFLRFRIQFWKAIHHLQLFIPVQQII